MSNGNERLNQKNEAYLPLLDPDFLILLSTLYRDVLERAEVSVASWQDWKLLEYILGVSDTPPDLSKQKKDSSVENFNLELMLLRFLETLVGENLTTSRQVVTAPKNPNGVTLTLRKGKTQRGAWLSIEAEQPTVVSRKLKRGEIPPQQMSLFAYQNRKLATERVSRILLEGYPLPEHRKTELTPEEIKAQALATVTRRVEAKLDEFGADSIDQVSISVERFDQETGEVFVRITSPSRSGVYLVVRENQAYITDLVKATHRLDPRSSEVIYPDANVAQSEYQTIVLTGPVRVIKASSSTGKTIVKHIPEAPKGKSRRTLFMAVREVPVLITTSVLGETSTQSTTLPAGTFFITAMPDPELVPIRPSRSQVQAPDTRKKKYRHPF